MDVIGEESSSVDSTHKSLVRDKQNKQGLT